jgi:hypothetical protein
VLARSKIFLYIYLYGCTRLPNYKTVFYLRYGTLDPLNKQASHVTHDPRILLPLFRSFGHDVFPIDGCRLQTVATMMRPKMIEKMNGHMKGKSSIYGYMKLKAFVIGSKSFLSKVALPSGFSTNHLLCTSAASTESSFLSSSFEVVGVVENDATG